MTCQQLLGRSRPNMRISKSYLLAGAGLYVGATAAAYYRFKGNLAVEIVADQASSGVTARASALDEVCLPEPCTAGQLHSNGRACKPAGI